LYELYNCSLLINISNAEARLADNLKSLKVLDELKHFKGFDLLNGKTGPVVARKTSEMVESVRTTQKINLPSQNEFRSLLDKKLHRLVDTCKTAGERESTLSRSKNVRSVPRSSEDQVYLAQPEFTRVCHDEPEQ
jgi:hypothetical protein